MKWKRGVSINSVPNDFDPEYYLDLYNLRKAGLSTYDHARSHYFYYGKKKNKPYKPNKIDVTNACIIEAKYGTVTNNIDVLDIVNIYVSDLKPLIVDNDTFKNDPHFRNLKILKLVLDSGKIYDIKEHETVCFYKSNDKQQINIINRELEKTVEIKKQELIDEKSDIIIGGTIYPQKIYTFFNDLGIYHIRFSKYMKKFSRICTLYNLQEHNAYCNDICTCGGCNAPCIFFGLYNDNDISVVKNHKGKKYIMWGGTDVDPRYELQKKALNSIKDCNNVFHIAISDNIKQRLQNLNIPCEHIILNLVNYNIFKPLSVMGPKIYIYNGYDRGNEDIYGKKIYEYVMKTLPEYEYILSTETKVPYEQMPNIYSQCFIGLRLTIYDGNANTVQEMGAMGINVVHNGNYYNSLNWTSKEDVVRIIKKEHDRIFKQDKTERNKILVLHKDNFVDIINKLEKKLPEYEFVSIYNRSPRDYFIGIDLDNGVNDIIEEFNYLGIKFISNCGLNNCIKYDSYDDIEMIIRYHNIDEFDKSIEKYKNILVICTDYPGWGGAATNAYEIIKYYEKKGKNIYGIYMTTEKPKKIFGDNIKIIKPNEIIQTLKILEFQPDLVILRNDIDFNIKNIINCPIYLLIPGIFGPKLNKYYWELDSKNKLDIYIKSSMIYTAQMVTKCYCASKHTQDILEKYYDLKINTLYFNYMPYYGQKIKHDIEWNNRKYDVGIIISDFNRIVKNIDKLVNNFIGSGLKVILIGKNSNKYSKYGFDCMELLDHDEVINYMKNIKYVAQDSFYESCSNVAVEATYEGCKLIKKIEEINEKKTTYERLEQEKLEQERLLKHKKLEQMNDKKCILIISTQYPNHGGAATLAYKLHKELLEKKYNSYCIFLNTYINSNKYNPDNLQNVYLEPLIIDNDYEYYKSHKYKIKPIIIIGLNYLAPIIGKKMYPKSKTFYYITGSKYNSNYNITAEHYLNNNTRNLDEVDDDEIMCINIVDYIIPNSYLTKNIYLKKYPSIITKLTDVFIFEELFFDKKSTIEEKIYDVAIISSTFTRNVKNINFLQNIYEHPNLSKYNKICIGEGSSNKINANIHFGKVTKEYVDKILAQTKVLLICSYYESLSISLIQAINNKCIVLSNNNIGGNLYLDKNNILDKYDENIWVNKIIHTIKNYKYTIQLQELNNKIPKTINLINIIDTLINYEMHIEKKKILFVSVDKPYDGGSSTNTMNLINNFSNDNIITPIGLFLLPNLLDIDTSYYQKIKIYFSLMDKNIEENIKNILQLIQKNEGKIDMYFVKNYKACVCLMKIIDKKLIIFSPSGSRVISSISNYYDKINYNQCATNQIFDPNMKLYDFINKYDKYLENYIYQEINYILPNSGLTFELIKKLYNVDVRLLSPINITYIDFKNENKNNENRNNEYRIYDIAFIAYSWKRNVKNYDFVKKLVMLDAMKNFNILIIGKDQINIPNSNILSLSNISNNEVNNILKKTKLFCINSYYDSSPNVLKEAVENDCRVLLTKNIGSNDLFNTDYIINKPDDTNEWVNKINYILNNYDSLNPVLKTQALNIKIALKNVILSIDKINKNNIINNNDCVGFYKLDPMWNNQKIIKTYVNYTEINNNDLIKIIKNIFNYDLYFEYFSNNFDNGYSNNKNNYHYVIYIKNKINVEFIQLNKLYPYIKNNLYIWFIGQIEHLNLFVECNKYYFRGNYYNLFGQIANNKYSELYCATSLYYDNNYTINTGEIIEYKFNKILVENDNIMYFQQKFPNSTIVNYIKKPTDLYMCLNMERTVDIIYIATENQPTKNRNLFVDFICYCENNNININIINIGKPDDYFKSRLNTLNSVKYQSYDYLESDELIKMYNISKINLVLSGRDALPRVIIESLACGCYNLALDTITDGKFLLHEPLGQLLEFPDLKKVYNSKTKSISYNSDDKIYKKIIEYTNTTYNHQLISLTFKSY